MEEENSKLKKEKKTISFKILLIRRIIFILIFAIIASGITAYFVIKNPFKQENPKVSSKEEILDNEVPKAPTRNHTSLLNYDTDTFDCNDLKISEISDNFEGYDVIYFQIDGLKNTSIQEKINSQLKNDLKESITKSKNEGKIKDNFNCNSYVYSSFANTLSLEYSMFSSVVDSNYDVTYHWESKITENFDLTTGNKIKIQDLFTDDTIGADIFDNTFYKELIKFYVEQDYHEDDDNINISVKDYKDIEEKILELIIKFNQGEDIPFCFDEQEVIFPDFIYARVYFDEHLDYIAIYNRYKTSETIFDGKYPHLHDLPVLTKRYYAYYQVLEENENYYIDVNLANSVESEKVMNSVFNYINDDIENMKSVNDKFHIYNYSYEIYDSDENVYTFMINTYTKETTRSLFNSEIKPKILNAFRKAPRIEGGDIYLFNNQFVYYMYDDGIFNNDLFQSEWETDSYRLFLDQNGNIYETEEEAKNPEGIEIKD